MAGDRVPLRFSGAVLAELPTPFTPDGDLDHPAVARLLSDAAGAADMLLVGGEVGEVLSLDGAQRRALAETTLAAAGASPVLVDVTAFSTRESAALQAHAGECGAAAVLIGAPYYTKLSAGEFKHQLSTLLAAATTPVILLLRPHTALPAPVADVLTACPAIAGVVDLRGDLMAAMDLFAFRAAADRKLPLAFPAALGTALALASPCGLVSALAPLAPRLLREAAVASAGRDAAALRRLWPALNDLERAIGRDPARLKPALARAGRPIGLPAAPLVADVATADAALARLAD